MKFKFGDRVIVNRKGFYEGARGVVVELEESNINAYLVQLSHGVPLWFDEDKLTLDPLWHLVQIESDV